MSTAEHPYRDSSTSSCSCLKCTSDRAREEAKPRPKRRKLERSGPTGVDVAGAAIFAAALSGFLAFLVGGEIAREDGIKFGEKLAGDRCITAQKLAGRESVQATCGRFPRDKDVVLLRFSDERNEWVEVR